MVAKRAKTTRGWAKKAPKTKRQRRALLVRCGRRAFLLPAELKFPVMAATGPCEIDCRAVRSALARAAQYGRRAIVRKARQLARRVACRWGD